VPHCAALRLVEGEECELAFEGIGVGGPSRSGGVVRRLAGAQTGGCQCEGGTSVGRAAEKATAVEGTLESLAARRPMVARLQGEVAVSFGVVGHSDSR
jgi:hypothetical protein